MSGSLNSTGATSRAGIALSLPEHMSSPALISGVRVTRSLVLCLCFLDRCLSFFTFSFNHCVICSLIYGFWLPLWYLQTLFDYPVWTLFLYYVPKILQSFSFPISFVFDRNWWTVFQTLLLGTNLDIYGFIRELFFNISHVIVILTVS